MARCRKALRRRTMSLVLIALTGCANAKIRLADTAAPELPASAAARLAAVETKIAAAPVPDALKQTAESATSRGNSAVSAESPSGTAKNTFVDVRPVSYRLPQRVPVQQPDSADVVPTAASPGGTLEINGRSYALLELTRTDTTADPSQAADGTTTFAAWQPEQIPVDMVASEDSETTMFSNVIQPNGSELPCSAISLNEVLSRIGGQNPTIGFAQWRVQEAYAELEASKALKLPSIRAGASFHRHDGQLQASNGQVSDVNRSSLQAGLGNGAVGAGTTPRQGIVAEFHMADAIFAPRIAARTAWAEGHAACTAMNAQLLEAALAYLELLQAEQEAAILDDTLRRTEQLAQITKDYAETGQGLRADADRMATELALVSNRTVRAREQSAVASCRLAAVLSTDSLQKFVPLETTVAPIHLVPPDCGRQSLLSHGLRHRPELKEAQNLVAAACERLDREKYAPLIPSLLLGVSQTGFGGDVGTSVDNYSDRFDFDAAVTWELRNLGFGEQAAQRRATAQVEQARFRQVRTMDQIAQQIGAAHTQLTYRVERIAVAERGIQSAEDSFRRNLERIRDGQGLPIEVLQSIRALEEARLAYLQAVSAYNEAQFRTQWAIGVPVSE
ncbi:MAG: TolC family protein [Fuerstiella sp.]